MELEEEYNQIQENLRSKIHLTDSFVKEEIKRVSGVDLAYWMEENKEYAVCCIVTMDYQTKEVLEIKALSDKIEVPYLAGYLSFRELPLIRKTFSLLEKETDIVLFDGNGVLHYRSMGIATHASFYIQKPTIGVAKSYLKVDHTEFIMPEDRPGAYTEILVNQQVYGRALRTQKGVKPIFVSCGNFISLDTATEIVLNLIEEGSRQPLPTRFADMETKKYRRNWNKLGEKGKGNERV